MAQRKPVRVRVTPGLFGLDAVRVDDDLTITKAWIEVSSTLAKKLVGSEYKGRPMYEFDEVSSDNDGTEDGSSEAEEAEQEDNS